MLNLFHGVRVLCMSLAAIVFIGQFAIVLMRYLLGFGLLELQDAVNYAFAMLAALSVAVAFYDDRHVRVDVFRQRWSSRKNRRIDWFGTLFLALPVFGLMLWAGFPLVRKSWAILEGSAETGGLPGLFVVKTCLVVLPLLVLILSVRQLVLIFRQSDK